MWDLRYARDGWAIESGQYQASSGGAKKRDNVPDWYRKRPRMERGDEFYIKAFWELSSCRQFGFSIGPIPWHRIVEYGRRKHLDNGMIDVLETVVRELDEAYLEWLRDGQRKSTEQTQRRARSQNP